jgi:hypothetical protein
MKRKGLPRIDKKLVFEKTYCVLHPQQLGLFGEVEQVKKKPTKEQIFLAAINEAREISEEARKKAREGKKETISRGAFAKTVAALYSWPELYLGTRGFVSQESAFTHRKTIKLTGRIRTYKGIDSMLYSLMNAGITKPNIMAMTRTILSIPEEKFTSVDFTNKTAGGQALKLYHEYLKPILENRKIYPPAYKKSEDIMGRIDHCIIVILYLRYLREWGQRQQKEIAHKIYLRKYGDLTPEQRWRRKMRERLDVQEELAKGVPFNQILDNLPPREIIEKKPRRPKNRFNGA